MPPIEHPERYTPGQLLAGRFRIVRFLGRGGMGEVYEAADLDLNQHVALKLVRPESRTDRRLLSLLRDEVRKARSVSHLNVCRVYDLERDDATGVAFVTMELLRGETLHARLDRAGPFSPADALPIIRQVAGGMDAIHARPMLHLDLKPANIMLESREGQPVRAVVTDFGLAQSQVHKDSVESTDSLVECKGGTPRYMSPERFLAGATPTPAADVYAFGLVACEMLAGSAWVGSPGIPPPSLRTVVPDAPAEWDAMVNRCLSRAPEDRFPNCGAAVDSLITEDAAGRSPTTSVVGTAHKPRTRALMAGILGAALFLLALVGVWFLGRHRPPAEAVRWYEEGARALRDGTTFTAMKAFERAVQLDGDFTLAHARLAEAATELDYMDKAKSEMLRASPPAYQSFFLSPDEKLRLQAVYFTLVKDPTSAAAKYRDLAAKVGQAERSAVLVDLGRAYESAGKIPDALASYSESAQGDSQFAAAFLRRGILEAKQQQSAKAVADFDVAEQLYRTEGKAEGLTEVLYQRASLLRRTGRLAEARAPSEKALEMARATGDEYHQIKGLLALSYLSYNSGDTEGGQQQAQQAIDLARRAGIEVLAASGLVDVGNAMFSKGDYAAAEPYLRNALESARRFQAVRVEARAELTLGQVLAKAGRIEEAVAVSRQAIEDFQRAGEKVNAARAVIPVSRMLRDQGDYEAAASLLRQQLQLAEQVKDEGSSALALQSLGSVLLLQEQYLGALESFDRSSEVSRAVADRSLEGYSQMGRAEVLWRLGRFPEAVESLKTAEALAQRLGGNKPLLASVYGARAGMDVSQQRFKEAEDDIRRMLDAEAKNPATAASAKRLLGLVRVATGRVQEGRALCDESVQQAKQTMNLPLLKYTELALAEAKLKAGDAAGARVLAAGLSEYFATKGQNASELHALALAAAASQGGVRAGYTASAKAALEKLRQSLGGEAFKGFATRPDIRVILLRAGVVSGVK